LAEPRHDSVLDLLRRRIGKAPSKILSHDLLACCEELQRQPIALGGTHGCRITHAASLAQRRGARVPAPDVAPSALLGAATLAFLDCPPPGMVRDAARGGPRALVADALAVCSSSL